MPITSIQIKQVLSAAADADTSIIEVIVGLLNNQMFSNDAQSLLDQSHRLLDELLYRDKEKVLSWAKCVVSEQCKAEVVDLLKNKSTLHLAANDVAEDKIQSFDIKTITLTYQSALPCLWYILCQVLNAETRAKYMRDYSRQALSRSNSQHSMVTRDELGNGDVEMGGPGTSKGIESDGQQELDGDTGYRRDQLFEIKILTCVSILLHHVNQNCNALQTIIGLFLHATGTPETVHELLAHVGLATSTTSTNKAINNLSESAMAQIRTFGQTMNVLYAYDNIDIHMKYSTPTVEHPEDTLIHLTSATMIPLSHGIQAVDLQYTPRAPLPIPPEKLLQIYPLAEPTPNAPLTLTRRDVFNKYMFLRDLVLHTPHQHFRAFHNNLKKPEPIEKLPATKTIQFPLIALDINPSTIAGNAQVITSLLQQDGVGDSSKNPSLNDVGNFAVLIAGDLLTGDRIRSLQDSRSDELTTWRRLDFLKFVMGLFHLKMACADAIWRIFIKSFKKDNADRTSLIEMIRQIRPQETGKFTSGTTFRRMHEAIQHVGIVLRQDCWRLKAKQKNGTFTSLEEFAKSQPSWDELESMANELCLESVNRSDRISKLRSATQRDEQYENSLLLQQYLLLYEELSYAMNMGDIGRVESCFLPWIWIFHACGKHKYAADMKQYLENIYIHFPKKLSNAIRMNILCNPLGKEGHFRAIDWLVEWNNLHIKRIYGGQYSNHTKERIIKESNLIEIFKRVRNQIEKNFLLRNKTIQHSLPDMHRTFARLAVYIEKEQVNEFIAGRKSNDLDYSETLPEVELEVAEEDVELEETN
ncbi:hypothetical protein F5887DRAFT_1079146 [Amanita rubescens]|nr:hypothetical protein F5887DRAFT_1079146 [Amanita rubescens]